MKKIVFTAFLESNIIPISKTSMAWIMKFCQHQPVAHAICLGHKAQTRLTPHYLFGTCLCGKLRFILTVTQLLNYYLFVESNCN